MNIKRYNENLLYLNLQVVFYEQDWNPQVDKQALQRAHRIGQMNNVLCVNLVTERTAEEVSFFILSLCCFNSRSNFLWFRILIYFNVGNYAEGREEIAA